MSDTPLQKISHLFCPDCGENLYSEGVYDKPICTKCGYIMMETPQEAVDRIKEEAE